MIEKNNNGIRGGWKYETFSYRQASAPIKSYTQQIWKPERLYKYLRKQALDRYRLP